MEFDTDFGVFLRDDIPEMINAYTKPIRGLTCEIWITKLLIKMVNAQRLPYTNDLLTWTTKL